jgi:hypothetical protein
MEEIERTSKLEGGFLEFIQRKDFRIVSFWPIF